MNYGIIDGAVSNEWKFYRPTVKGVATETALADPEFDPTYPQAQRGRYILDDGLVRGWIQLGMVGNFTTPQCAWLIKLPVPAARPHPTLPVVIGTGMVYHSFDDPNKSVPAVPILADMGWRKPANTFGSVDNPDEYFQLQCPYALRFGTGTSTGAGQVNWTHNLYAYNSANMCAAEHECWYTSSAGTASTMPLQVATGYVSTSFIPQAAPSASRTYAAKARVELLTHRGNAAPVYFTSDPSVPTSIPMMGKYHPFNQAELTSLSPYGNVFVSFRYAPA